MEYSLVTTCYNEIRGLPQWKKDIESQTWQPDEIVIVDSESNDGTTEYLKNWAAEDPRVTVIVEKCNPAHGRNIAIQQAKFERILSTDMGVRLDSKWIEELVKPIEENPVIEVVRGNSKIDLESLQSTVARADYYINGGDPVVNSKNRNERLRPGNRSVCYTKTLWKSLGGLPEDLTFYADDVVFGTQILYSRFKMVNAPDALAYWERHSSLKDFWKEMFNYGKGDGEALVKMPFAFKLYLKGYLPRYLVKPLTALRLLQQQATLRAFVLALRHYDLKAIPIIPILSFGKGWFFAKGYLIGKAHGDKHCLDARNRIKKYRSLKIS